LNASRVLKADNSCGSAIPASPPTKHATPMAKTGESINRSRFQIIFASVLDKPEDE
jgi:hypothetical protein